MKKIFLTLAAFGMTLCALAQPQLNKNNIEDVIKAMTLQEKATLLVGGARAAMVNGVTSGTAWQGRFPAPPATPARSSASASPAPSSPTALPACASSLPVRVTVIPITAPVSRWVPCSPAPGTSPSWRM